MMQDDYHEVCIKGPARKSDNIRIDGASGFRLKEMRKDVLVVLNYLDENEGVCGCYDELYGYEEGNIRDFKKDDRYNFKAFYFSLRPTSNNSEDVCMKLGLV